MIRTRMLLATSPALALALVAGRGALGTPSSARPDSAGSAAPEALLSYGEPVRLGKGRVRAYVLKSQEAGAPVEIGVALDERAVEGLPSSGSGHHDGHTMMHEYVVQLPAGHGTPFRFVGVNWNPHGHEPEKEGFWMVPHFDFHFYTISKAERDSIVPDNPRYEALANDLPASEYVPPFNIVLAPPAAPPSAVAVPLMGVHWVDTRSPELQRLLGKPEAYKPFTSTFIYGSWGGRFHFLEPMITLAHILEKRSATDPTVRDQVIPIATPSRYQVAGYYPKAYRIAWDPQAKEYRIALTQLAWGK